MSDLNTCACGSTVDLSQCCLPIIQGSKKAVTAEELLCARYTAFTLGEIEFILSSHHSQTRSQVDRNEIEDWSKNSKWLGLKVLGRFPDQRDKEGVEQTTLIFSASFESPGQKKQDHIEKSCFKKEMSDWKFFDSELVNIGTYKRTEPKVGRNDPCSCGSGKKFKKCHGNTTVLV